MQHALQYLRLGFSVIPLRPRGKEPLIPWQEYQKRFASVAEIRKWFADGTANLGIVTGSVSKLAVVDLDGIEGMKCGRSLKLASRATVITGKGKQLYYKHPGGNVCNAVRKYPGVDIRGDGGYCVAPPSIHPNGKRYQWLTPVGPATALPAFPALFSMATSTTPSATTRNADGWISSALADMKSGNIDDTLFKICSRLRADGYSQADTRTLLAPHAARAGATPGHLDAKIRNVWTRYAPNNRQADENADEQGAESIDAFMESLSPVEWICPPMIAKGTLGFVAGLPETMKTWLLIDLAVECARGGGTWLGLFPVGGARVLFVDQERFKGETQRRFGSLLAEKGLESSSLRDSLFIRCGTRTRLDVEPSYRKFHQELLKIKPDVVIIDSFVTMHTSDENSRQGIQVVMERLKALRTEIGCTFIFLDHESKAVWTDKESNEVPSAMRMVGSVAKSAAAEFVLTVRRFDEETVIVHHTKATLGAAVKSFIVRVVDTERGVRVYGEGEAT